MPNGKEDIWGKPPIPTHLTGGIKPGVTPPVVGGTTLPPPPDQPSLPEQYPVSELESYNIDPDNGYTNIPNGEVSDSNFQTSTQYAHAAMQIGPDTSKINKGVYSIPDTSAAAVARGKGEEILSGYGPDQQVSRQDQLRLKKLRDRYDRKMTKAEQINK